MKDLNSAEEFFDKYTDALVVCATLQYFGMDTATDKPIVNKIQDRGMELDPQKYVWTVLGEMVDTFVMKDTPKPLNQTPSSKYTCQTCAREYKKLTSLMQHIKKKHENSQKASLPPCSGTDHKYNYVTNALNLGMLVKNFTDARRLGDGERVFRQQKFTTLLQAYPQNKI